MTDKKYAQYQPLERGPLDGVRVLDLSRLVAGNMLTLQLADFGAEVIKVEPYRGDPLRDWKENGISLFWKVYSRNKKSVRLDLKRPEDKERFKQLVPTSHVIVESFRPGVMEALGFAPDVVLRLNPGVVMVRLSGWGQTGPYQESLDLAVWWRQCLASRQRPGLKGSARYFQICLWPTWLQAYTARTPCSLHCASRNNQEGEAK